MPHRFYVQNGVMWFRAWAMSYDPDGWIVEESDEYTLATDELSISFPELQAYHNFLRDGRPPLTQIKGICFHATSFHQY